MFKQMKNIDTAFQHIRSFTLLVVAGSFLLSGFAIYKSNRLVSDLQSKIYILANGKALQAYATDRKDNIPVEARDHIKTFHELFYTLDPDDKVIRANVTKALYLAGNSAKTEYDNLTYHGYYSGMIAGNISQRIKVDSVAVEVSKYPYYFRLYATLSIIRTTSTVLRSLITEGYLRNVSQSDNNPHGFLIEQWRVLQNEDLKTENR